uniref:Exportin-1/Importin-beta-like domain-containing protein n=1 Tax=Alexandrium monilatum TaxID=311494 RepID=A0A7S4QI09_9DINO
MSWFVLMSPPAMTPSLAPKAASLAAELQRRVICFAAGDELYAGEWLTNFQRAEGAWDVCVEALRPGPQPTCDAELLQEFCAQTLARLARAFAGHHPASAQRPQRDSLRALLTLHVGPSGRPEVWRQLALALTCADLWLGTWAPPLPAPAAASLEGGGSLPWEVRRELLALPAELLFCDRALPLDDLRLRQAAAGALLDACGAAFTELLLGGSGADAAKVSKERQSVLRTLAEWLRALRKALRLLPTHDPAMPLRVLVVQGDRLLELTRANPADASEVLQQLVRWHLKGCEKDLAMVLRPLLECLFNASSGEVCQSLLPLLTDLAGGCWPQAVLGDFDLDWHSIAVQALAAIRMAVEGAGLEETDGDANDAEAALAVWQTFAVTVREGTHGEPDLLEQLPGLAISKVERPEKRSRMFEEDEWHASPERIANCEALPQLFGLLASEMLELLHVPPDPADAEGLLALRDVRAAAQSTLSAWAVLVGRSALWQQATWSPLQQVGARLTGSGAEPLPEEAYREAEAVLWFSGTLAESWPGAMDGPGGAVLPPASAVLELGAALDAAPEQWRPLLWAAASSLARTGPAEYCQRLLEWTLQRPPTSSCYPELVQLVELPYAESIERLCRHLSTAGEVHVAVGERLAALAFEARPAAALHEDSVKAQSLMLLAMRHSMGSDATLLCQGLAQKVIPALCQAAEAEAQTARAERDPPWRAAQALFGTLSATLPAVAIAPNDRDHPAVGLWRDRWPYVEAALLRWPPSDASDQPHAAAAAALVAAAQMLPVFFPESVQVLARSAAQHELPQVQLEALRKVLASASCRTMDAAGLTELLNDNVLTAVEALLSREDALVANPPTVSALFRLLCDEKLRSLLLARPALGERCLVLVTRALPECTSADAAASILHFTAELVGSQDELSAEAAHRQMLVAAIPELCAAVCRALASHEHLAELDEGLLGAAEFLLRCSDALPAELQPALAAGLRGAQVAEWSSERLQRHVAGRADWPRKGEWLDQLQQIVCECQRERRRATLL